MTREVSAQPESESERVPSKKQKKAETPVDDPMDEDDNGEVDGEEDEGEEYEIEKILDSSMDVFQDREKGYLVKWKGYPNSENSWVRESDAPNAGDLIDRFMEERARKEAAERKKLRKSVGQEPKKRGRPSTRSKADSDEEEPEQSPVERVPKKQKKGKAVASSVQDEPESDAEFVPMDKYMELDRWDDLIAKIETVDRDEHGELSIYGKLATGEFFRLPAQTANLKFPQKVIEFYERNLRWKIVDEGQ